MRERFIEWFLRQSPNKRREILEAKNINSFNPRHMRTPTNTLVEQKVDPLLKDITSVLYRHFGQMGDEVLDQAFEEILGAVARECNPELVTALRQYLSPEVIDWQKKYPNHYLYMPKHKEFVVEKWKIRAVCYIVIATSLIVLLVDKLN